MQEEYFSRYEQHQRTAMNEESAVALLEKKRKKGAFQGLPAFDSTITLEAFPVTVSFSHYWTFPTRGLALRVLIFFLFFFFFFFLPTRTALLYLSSPR